MKCALLERSRNNDVNNHFSQITAKVATPTKIIDFPYYTVLNKKTISSFTIAYA